MSNEMASWWRNDRISLDETTELDFDGGGTLRVTRGDLEDVARAFGFDPRGCGPCDVEHEAMQSVALAHHLLGLPAEKFRETGLMLAQRPDTWREYDSARRLGAGTFDLQKILLQGIFNEVTK